MSFADTLPAHLREACWLPRQSVTLGWWPMGQGYTVFESKYSPRLKLMAHNVSLVTTVEDL